MQVPGGRPDLAGRVVLVTGGTGSFGRVVVRRLLAAGCAEVRVLSRDEAKQYAMRFEVADPRLRLLLGDVRDRDSVEGAVLGADLVFHAAALKQVPNCEAFPEQAVLTNVTGSRNVLRAAVAAGVERVVCLSTDKAVYPVNAMGMTKALMEKLVQAESRRGGATTLCVVRYGNVLCSRGSVVPAFIERIAAGHPLGVTVPGMTRFLLRLEEAVDLVETALADGAPGDTFIRRSPACTVGTLAQALLDLFAAESPIIALGARPGEKMHETLATVEEMRVAIDRGDAWRIPAERSDLIDPDPARRLPHVGHDYNSEHAERLGVDAVRDLLASLPEVRSALEAHRRRAVHGVSTAARRRERLPA